MTYTICLAGHLDPRWVAIFAGFSMSHDYDGEQRPVTLLHGPVADSAALYGLVSRLRDLGVTLISLQPAGAVCSTQQTAHSTTDLRRR
jgi:hypothetical protein